MTGGRPLPPVALHMCCGPCATVAIERLSENFRVEAVWYNPNIHPEEEYARRLDATRSLTEALNIPLTELAHDVPAWDEACAGLLDEPEGGARCPVCFEMRLRVVAAFAAEREIEYFTTTLTLSPHKPVDIINTLGERIAAEHGVEFLWRDFKKRDGFARSIEM